MSMARTKENFGRILADSESRVLALSGKWGTGKSFMWKDVQGASVDPVIKTALYISLFGAASIAEIKLKLAQSSIPLLDKKGPGMDALKSSINATKQVAKAFFSGVSAFDEIDLLAVPALVRNKFIVVDIKRTAYGFRDASYFFLKIKDAFPG